MERSAELTAIGSDSYHRCLATVRQGAKIVSIADDGIAIKWPLRRMNSQSQNQCRVTDCNFGSPRYLLNDVKH